MDNQKLKPKVAAKTVDPEVASGVGEGSFAAVPLAAWTKRAIARLDTGMVNEHRRMP